MCVRVYKHAAYGLNYFGDSTVLAYGFTVPIAFLVANMFFPSMIAHFTFDITTPNETAFALFFNIPYSRLMTSAAAHYFTTIDSWRCSVA